jgi:hypothetical protein
MGIKEQPIINSKETIVSKIFPSLEIFILLEYIMSNTKNINNMTHEELMEERQRIIKYIKSKFKISPRKQNFLDNQEMIENNIKVVEKHKRRYKRLIGLIEEHIQSIERSLKDSSREISNIEKEELKRNLLNFGKAKINHEKILEEIKEAIENREMMKNNLTKKYLKQNREKKEIKGKSSILPGSLFSKPSKSKNGKNGENEENEENNFPKIGKNNPNLEQQEKYNNSMKRNKEKRKSRPFFGKTVSDYFKSLKMSPTPVKNNTSPNKPLNNTSNQNPTSSITGNISIGVNNTGKNRK